VAAFSDPNVIAVLCLALVSGLAMATVKPHHGGTNVLVEGITQLREVRPCVRARRRERCLCGTVGGRREPGGECVLERRF